MKVNHFWMLVAWLNSRGQRYMLKNLFLYQHVLGKKNCEVYRIEIFLIYFLFKTIWNKGVLLSFHFLTLFLWKSRRPREDDLGLNGTHQWCWWYFYWTKKNEVCSYFTCQNTAQNHDIRMGHKIPCKCGRVWAWEWQSQIMVKLWGN